MIEALLSSLGAQTGAEDAQQECVLQGKQEPRVRPSLVCLLRLIPGTEAFLGLGFHNFRVICAKRTHILACFSPKIKDSRHHWDSGSGRGGASTQAVAHGALAEGLAAPTQLQALIREAA